MAGTIFGVFCLVSFVCACVTGNLSALGNALFDGVSHTVSLMLTLGGAMCFWCGILEVLRNAGAIGVLQRLLSPLLGILFPAAKRLSVGMEEITASLSANLLGIGNAATPLGLRAMDVLEEAAESAESAESADFRRFTNSNALWGDMTMFTVLNTAPPALLPTTLLALRRAAGSENPACVLPAIWIVSFAGFFFAAVVCRAIVSVRLGTSKQARRHKEIFSRAGTRSPS